MKDLTVLMLNYNCNNILQYAVKSVLMNTSDRLKKIIIGDSGSTDGSLDALPESDKIEIIRYKQKEPKGSRAKGEGLNVLFPNCDTEFCAIIENDSFMPTKNWDLILHEYIKDNVVIIGADYQTNDGQINELFTSFSYFRYDILKNLGINFMPRKRWFKKSFSKGTDCGYEMRDKLPRSGFSGKTLKCEVCTWNGCEIFKNIVCAEHSIKDKVIWVHFSRGSNIKAKSYCDPFEKLEKWKRKCSELLASSNSTD